MKRTTDNAAFRALLTLPPIQSATTTALIVPEMPTPGVVTGDKEIDAVLWLRKVISTGQAPLIQKALESAKLIETPLKVLEKRYTDFLIRTNPGNWVAAMSSFGFADLEDLAKSAIKKRKYADEALARFGTVEALFAKTPAEEACEVALKGLKPRQPFSSFADAKARDRFDAVPELRPHTLADCLYAEAYESALYRLRQAAVDNAGDHWPAFQAHRDYCFASLARIPPRTKAEALAVLEHLLAEEAMDRVETPAILRNLVGAGLDTGTAHRVRAAAPAEVAAC